MKPWQKGIPIEEIERHRKAFAHYNSFSLSPFTEYNGPRIADALHKDHLYQLEKGPTWVHCHWASTSTDITMFSDVKIARKEKGDLVIHALTIDNERDIASTAKALARMSAERIWLYIWEEDPIQYEVARQAGFQKAGVKIRSTSEIYGIYHRGCTTSIMPIPRSEKTTLTYLDVPVSPFLPAIEKRLHNMSMDFTNHYSNNNKARSWSAISLRGYSPEPSFIEKPSAMPEKWQKSHPGPYRLQNTTLMESFPEVKDLTALMGVQFERIRFMRLSPGGGELTRHTDQTDPHLGTSDGRIMRIHVPIITNPEVKFTIWNYHGEKKEAHMAKGQAWYLDIRKPHRAINGGTTERIHLVMDAIACTRLRNLLM